MKHRVAVNIRAKKYTIVAEESPDHIQQCAQLVNRELDRAMNGTTLSVDDGMTLAAMNLADLYEKERQVSDNLRAQLKQALDENARLRRQRGGKKNRHDRNNAPQYGGHQDAPREQTDQGQETREDGAP